jgi:D-alanyl-D-alanine carboxypeptidase
MSRPRRHRGPRGREVDPIRRLWAELGIPADYAARREIPRQREARRLVVIGANCRLTPGAARAWRAMQSAARDHGVTLILLSGFRSVRRQAAIIRRKLRRGQRLADILKSVAAPGCSEHHTGCALDLGDGAAPPLDEGFAQTKAFRWLVRHGSRFGYRLSYPRRNPQGFVFEPWHWRWRARRGLTRR